ncbi:ATP-binding protein [Corynebacterium sp. H128]|uniref:ATP-binding protein n=1 Tax=Corynebacterium sp. H128 TaxID=3133427 RepID=UPI0030976F8E
MNAFDYDDVQTLHPTVAGLLALGRYPQRFFPQLFIDVTTHPSTVKSSGERGLRFVSRRRCDGAIPEAIESAATEVMGNLKTRYLESNGTIIDQKEIPEMAIREAIANAVMHRDYGPFARGEQVAVDIYSDRVEIVNPGGLWGGRTEENITDGRSVTRNEVLATILSHLHNGRSERIAENQGSGIPAMIRSMTQHGLGAPVFRNEISDFRVILPRFGLLNDEAQAWLSRRGHTRNPHSDIALLLAREHGSVSTLSLRDHLGIDSDEARETLASLLVDDQLFAIGPEEFALGSAKPPVTLSKPAAELYEYVDLQVARKTSELAELWGRTESTVRMRIKELIEAGLVEATAPPTSKLRAYRRAAE